MAELFPTRVEAQERNRSLMAGLEGRAQGKYGVLKFCLEAYQRAIQSRRSPDRDVVLGNLTRYLLEAAGPTQASIRARMIAKWRDRPELVERSVANSLRRSAGTNYQALISYALAFYLSRSGSQWYLEHPVPEWMRSAIAIRFTAGVIDVPEGVDAEPAETDLPEGEALDAELAALVAAEEVAAVTDGEGAGGPQEFVVKPDVDILLRNAAWPADRKPEPVVLLSVKTSLADRAGSAARWKTYFDQVMNPCPYLDRPDCAYRRLGITMKNPDLFNIEHGLVTANIYKINYHDTAYAKGELASGQTQSNTYMFGLKLTTRDDGIAVTPTELGWRRFPYITEFLAELSRRYGLPD